MSDMEAPDDDVFVTTRGLYMLYVDGAKKANAPGKKTATGAIGVFLTDAKGREIPKSRISKAVGPVPDPHTAEYKALLAGIELARDKGIKHLVVFSDSRTLVNQVNKLWKHHTDHLKKLCLEAQGALDEFAAHQVSWIPREWNRRADRRASRALADS